MKRILLLSLVALSTAFCAAKPPNIVMIVSDDQGFHDIGYRSTQIKTPHLDALAAAGVKLESHYVFPTCSPTRCALLTGMNPARYGILGPIGGESTLSVPLEIPNLATLLKSRGYHTALSGKWHLNLSFAGGPRKYGFDTSYGYLHGQIDPLLHDYKTGKATWHRNDEPLTEPGHATDLIAAEAVRVIAERRAAPLFLYVAFSVPHEPLIEEARWTDIYASVFPENSRQLVAASITHMDDAIGRIVAALEHAGLRENTLLIFTSDNGGPEKCDGEDYGGRFRNQNGPHSDNSPLRGFKSDLWEGGIRVPAFANWPGTLKPRSEPAVFSALDWLPTIAALSGAALPQDATDGRDMGAVLSGNASGTARTLFWRTGKSMAVRDGAWKLIAAKGRPDELYRIGDDAGERHESAAAQEEIARQLHKKLKAWKDELPEAKKK